MRDNILSRVQHLSDCDLVARVKRLARHEREATAVLVAHLAVFDERRLYLGEGCASLFTYCTQVLHLAEYAAYNRIEAARAAQKFPGILALLAEGALTLATVRILAPHLTPGNHAEFLAAARYTSKREVEDLVAHLCPQPSVPSTIRRLPVPSHPDPATHLDSATTTGQITLHSASEGQTEAATEPRPAAMPAARRSVIEPLGARRYRVQFTASTETCDKLRLIQDLLRHQIPDGDLGEIMDRALTLLLEALAKQRFAAAAHPRSRASHGDASSSASRHIPADVRRAIWLRDGGRCAFVAHEGRRCKECGFLEFHHVVPYAAGGAATPDNIQLRCRRHNRYEAELFFSRDVLITSTRPQPDGLVNSGSSTHLPSIVGGSASARAGPRLAGI